MVLLSLPKTCNDDKIGVQDINYTSCEPSYNLEGTVAVQHLSRYCCPAISENPFFQFVVDCSIDIVNTKRDYRVGSVEQHQTFDMHNALTSSEDCDQEVDSNNSKLLSGCHEINKQSTYALSKKQHYLEDNPFNKTLPKFPKSNPTLRRFIEMPNELIKNMMYTVIILLKMLYMIKKNLGESLNLMLMGFMIISLAPQTECAMANRSTYIHNHRYPVQQTAPMSSIIPTPVEDMNNDLERCSDGEEDQPNLHQRQTPSPDPSINGPVSYNCRLLSQEMSNCLAETSVTNNNVTAREINEDTEVKDPGTCMELEANSTSGIGTLDTFDECVDTTRSVSDYASMENAEGINRVSVEYFWNGQLRGFRERASSALHRVINRVRNEISSSVEDLGCPQDDNFYLYLQRESSEFEAAVNITELSTAELQGPIRSNLIFVIRTQPI